MYFAGKDERQEQAGAAVVRGDQGFCAETGREDKGDPQDLAADDGEALGSLSQHLHAGFRRLLRSVLLGANYGGRADPAAHRWLHRYHTQEGKYFHSKSS